MLGRREELEGEGAQLSSGQRNTPYWQGRKRRMEEWVLVPTDEEEAGMGQLGLVQTEPWLAAAVAAHSSALLSFFVVPSCFLHPDPNHHAAAAKNLRTAAADIGIEGVGFLLV